MGDFERKLARLEEIQEQLRRPEAALEESLTLFEEGMALADELEKTLRKAEQRVELLLNPELSADDTPEFTPL